MRLLWGEYGTSRRPGLTGKLLAVVHCPSFQHTNSERFSRGSYTISKTVPSSKMAETVGILYLFACLPVFFGCGFMLRAEFFQTVEHLKESEMLDLADEGNDVAVLLASIAAE